MARHKDFFDSANLDDTLWKLNSLGALLLDLYTEATFNAGTCRDFSVAADWRYVARLADDADKALARIVKAVESARVARGPGV